MGKRIAFQIKQTYPDDYLCPPAAEFAPNLAEAAP